MKNLILLLSSVFLTVSCSEPQNAIKSHLLEVPYGINPETPSQAQLDTLIVFPLDTLNSAMITVPNDEQQQFYTFKDKPFSGWAWQDFLKDNNRFRYSQVDSGMVTWQIDYFDNGILASDFHLKNGVNHGSQKMWRQDGSPYVVNNYQNGLMHGIQRRWNKNGQLEWEAEYIDGDLIREVYYNMEGKISKFSGAFELPIPSEQVVDSIYSIRNSGHYPLHAYLLYYFDSRSPVVSLNDKKGYMCHFKQSFVNEIEFEAFFCSLDVNWNKIKFPKTKISRLKKILYPLYRSESDEDTSKWSNDTLWYTEYGNPNEMGCQFIIEEEDEYSTIEMVGTE